MTRSPFAALLLLASVHAADTARLDRDDLLLFHDDAGAVQRGKTIADWEKRRAEVLRGMRAVTGPLPHFEKRWPLNLAVEEETDEGDHLRRKITYASEPGGRAQAWLLIPKAALEPNAKVPAVLCLHPTSSLGNKTVVLNDAAPNRAYALELARRGYVAIAPAYPWLASYEPDLAGLGYASLAVHPATARHIATKLAPWMQKLHPIVFGTALDPAKHWTKTRNLPDVAPQTFTAWMKARKKEGK